VKVDTQLDEEMSPVLQTLNGEGSLRTRDLSLGEVQFLKQVAEIVKKPSLADTRVKDLTIDFTITEGRLATKPFDLRLGDYVMNLSGTTGLDQTIDYRGKITLPASAGNISKLGTVDMTIGGTFSSPKVGIDMESLAKQAAQQATEKVVEKLGEKLFGGKSEDAEGATTEGATAEEQTKQQKAAETVKGVLNLLKKKN
jgi:hypothetical protein